MSRRHAPRLAVSPDLRRETAAAVRLALPIILVQLGTMLMGTVDVMMLGRSSEADLASGSIGHTLAFGLLIFPISFLSALDALASQAYGAGADARLARYCKQGITAAVAVSVPISVLMWDAAPFLRWAGQPPEIIVGTSGYLRALMPGNVALLLYTALQRTLQSMSIVRPAFVAIAVANVVNFVADYVLIFGHFGLPALGVVGAGWSTAVSRWVMVIALAAGSAGVLKRYLAIPAGGLLRLRSYATFASIGTPIGVQISVEYWLFGCVSLMMGHLGTRAAAGHQVAINLASLGYMVVLGLAGAAATRVGNAVGRRDMPGARRAAAVCLGLGGVASLAIAVVFLSWPRQLSQLYTPESGVIALASSLVPIAGVFALFDGIQAVSSGILRGTADTRVPATLALVGYWLLGLPLGTTLAFTAGLGPQGLWWGLTAGLASVAALLLIRLVRRFRTEITVVE